MVWVAIFDTLKKIWSAKCIDKESFNQTVFISYAFQSYPSTINVK